ncbi:hypothetical protein E2C01_058371 [Portunus trituberculatus]|uniref:Uncharacterized protein n=1 Tax=Portunus trituberculatus TaxID=210409 RepID=A0A5B7H2T3_PORTR|nr:hypothetical protein [Portunus trituberculatus]
MKARCARGTCQPVNFCYVSVSCTDVHMNKQNYGMSQFNTVTSLVNRCCCLPQADYLATTRTPSHGQAAVSCMNMQPPSRAGEPDAGVTVHLLSDGLLQVCVASTVLCLHVG